MPGDTIKALLFAVLIWAIGFVWGSIVFMTPALKATAPIPYVSSNPWISFPILLVWPVAAYLLAKRYLASSPEPGSDGLKLGLVFSVTSLLLDLIVLVLLLSAGWRYFASVSVWIGYAILLLVPWWVGRAAEHRQAAAFPVTSRFAAATIFGGSGSAASSMCLA